MRRVELTNAERIEIINHHSEMHISNKVLSVWACAKLGKSISEMAISRLLKRKDALLRSMGAKIKKRYRKPKCPNLESILYAWFLMMEEANVTISDSMLIEKAKMLQNSVPWELEKEIKFSNGWFAGFKSRHGISVHVRHSESGSAEITEEVLDCIEGLKALISGYDPKDVFNMDDTSLFFQLEPNRTLATRVVNGKKKSKNRLSIALTANMTRTSKFPPFVIYKYLKPHPLTRRSVCVPENLGILWSANSKAWMTIKLFEQFLLDFEKRVKEAGRKKSTSRWTLVSSELLKAHYRKRLIHLKLERLQIGQAAEVDVYDAVAMLEKAWRVDVTAKTVKRCWIHSKLVDAEVILPDFNSAWELPDLNVGIYSDGVRELRAAIFQLEEATADSGIVPNMTATEYIEFENVYEIEDPLSIEELAEFQALGDTEATEEADPDPARMEIIATSDLIQTEITSYFTVE
ncbi:hypothetical protein R1sor_021232 [Riccia sorocarpa]|uniref:HTH CENPB-type domain-containing protein n=1 Tax=Riccia sorocarpa TaxID=122646 RepID=A0ABD3GHY3_9MARC